MSTVVPSLSARGWAQDIEDKADLLLSYYFSTDYLQSVLWVGSVTSFSETLEKHNHNPDQLRASLEVQLLDYLSRYFEAATVDVTAKKTDPAKDNELTLEFNVKVQQDGKLYSLGRVVETIDSKILKIFDLING